MKRRTMLWMLAALNVVLATALVWKLGGEPSAQAQMRGPRGDYVMIPAKMQGANNGVVYMIDTRNGLLSAFIYDNSAKELVSMPPIDLARFMSPAGRR
jgi:hypothetical protein